MLFGLFDFEVNLDIAPDKSDEGDNTGGDELLTNAGSHDVTRILHDAGSLIVVAYAVQLELKELASVQWDRNHCDCHQVAERGWSFPEKIIVD